MKPIRISKSQALWLGSKVRKLIGEGYAQRQAVAIAYNYARRKNLIENPMANEVAMLIWGRMTIVERDKLLLAIEVYHEPTRFLIKFKTWKQLSEILRNKIIVKARGK